MPSDGETETEAAEDRPPLGRDEIALDRSIRTHKYTLLALRRCRRAAAAGEIVTGRVVSDQLKPWIGEHERGTVHSSLNKLADEGLVAKEPAGRANDYHITDRGQRIMRCFGWNNQERRIDIETDTK